MLATLTGLAYRPLLWRVGIGKHQLHHRSILATLSYPIRFSRSIPAAHPYRFAASSTTTASTATGSILVTSSPAFTTDIAADFTAYSAYSNGAIWFWAATQYHPPRR